MNYIIFPIILSLTAVIPKGVSNKLEFSPFLLSNAFEEVSLCISFSQTFDVEGMFSWFDFCLWKLNWNQFANQVSLSRWFSGKSRCVVCLFFHQSSFHHKDHVLLWKAFLHPLCIFCSKKTSDKLDNWNAKWKDSLILFFQEVDII